MTVSTVSTSTAFTLTSGNVLRVRCQRGESAKVRISNGAHAEGIVGDGCTQDFGPYSAGSTANIAVLFGSSVEYEQATALNLTLKPYTYKSATVESDNGSNNNLLPSPSSAAAVAAAMASGYQGVSNALNEIWSLGDSICANGYSAPTSSRDIALGGDSWLMWACVLSAGTLTWGGTASQGGIDTATCISTYLPVIEAAKPRFCVVHIGTNNNPDAPATTIADLRTIYTRLLRAGVIPIATAMLPKATLINNAAYKLQRLTLRISKMAREMGIPFCDWSPQLLKNTGTGEWVSAAYSSDGTHMLEPAAKPMGASLLASIQPWMTPGTNYFAHVQDNAGLTSHTPCTTNALQLTDTNADGLSDGWNGSGNGTATLSAMSASEGLGNWQVFTASGASSMQRTGGNVAMVPGNRYLLSFKFKSSNIVGSSGQFTIRFCDANSNPIVQLQALKSDVTLGAFYREFVWPSAAATNNGRLEVLVSGTNAVLSIGQYMCLDLTANGLA